MIKIGSLFSGIGGLELGLERGLREAGHEVETVWQVEREPFGRAVLAKHWPHATRYDDVRTVGADLEPVDLLCGGFPCQDISIAGKQAGITTGSKSGLFHELIRIARVVRPRFLVLENVSAILTSNGGSDLATVLGEVATLGYDGWWDCVPAKAVGAPHQRDRWFFVGELANGCGKPVQSVRGPREVVGPSSSGEGKEEERKRVRNASHSGSPPVAHTDSHRREAANRLTGPVGPNRGNALSKRQAAHNLRGHIRNRGWTYTQPGLGGEVDGVSPRVDAPVMRPTATASTGSQVAEDPTPGQTGGTSLRGAGVRQPLRPLQPWEGDTPRVALRDKQTANRLKALGNAVVPQVAEVIGLFVASLITGD